MKRASTPSFIFEYMDTYKREYTCSRTHARHTTPTHMDPVWQSMMACMYIQKRNKQYNLFWNPPIMAQKASPSRSLVQLEIPV